MPHTPARGLEFNPYHHEGAAGCPVVAGKEGLLTQAKLTGARPELPLRASSQAAEALLEAASLEEGRVPHSYSFNIGFLFSPRSTVSTKGQVVFSHSENLSALFCTRTLKMSPSH